MACRESEASGPSDPSSEGKVKRAGSGGGLLLLLLVEEEEEGEGGEEEDVGGGRRRMFGFRGVVVEVVEGWGAGWTVTGAVGVGCVVVVVGFLDGVGGLGFEEAGAAAGMRDLGGAAAVVVELGCLVADCGATTALDEVEGGRVFVMDPPAAALSACVAHAQSALRSATCLSVPGSAVAVDAAGRGGAMIAEDFGSPRVSRGALWLCKGENWPIGFLFCRYWLMRVEVVAWLGYAGVCWHETDVRLDLWGWGRVAHTVELEGKWFVGRLRCFVVRILCMMNGDQREEGGRSGFVQ